jgi:cytoskeletal protein CcmA (bactofilin family)
LSLFGGKRRGEDEAEAAAPSGSSAGSTPGGKAAGPGSAGNVTSQESAGASPDRRRSGNTPQSMGGRVATIGATIQFKGDLTGDEDLEILGQIEGKIDLPSHQLTIGDGGRVKAEISAQAVLVQGHVTGNITATERLEVQASGIVDGDIRAPRLLIAEGAVVNGAIEMTGKSARSSAAPPKVAAPAAAAGGASS